MKINLFFPGDLSPILTFTIGFYVSYIAGRWWNVFMSIPWPDSTVLSISAFLRDRGRQYKVDMKGKNDIIIKIWNKWKADLFIDSPKF